VLNLGLIIGLGLELYGETLTDFLDHNPEHVREVLLLVTPQTLTDPTQVGPSQELWRQLRTGRDEAVADAQPTLMRRSGMTLFKERLVDRLLNVPLRGKGGQFYGFSSGLADYLFDHHGSMIDPAEFRPPAHPVLRRYDLAASLEPQCRAFRNHVPSAVRLVVGLSPIPHSLCSPEYRHSRDHLLQRLGEWLRADVVLTNAPVDLPDGLFASEQHLNQRGQRFFTGRLASMLMALGTRDSAKVDLDAHRPAQLP
jgi:hypothetical protein